MKKWKFLGIVVFYLFCVGVGSCIGYLMAIGKLQGKDLILGCLAVIITYYLQIIIHEIGHAVFGLLSGYEFLSFRVGGLILVKKNGKLEGKRFSLKGTGGQCLLYYPGNNKYDFPYVLYNLGGVLGNFIAGLLPLFLYFAFPLNKILGTLVLINFFVAIFLSFTNGIPMKVGGIPNDAYNIILMRKDREARKSFWVQLQVTALLSKGTRLKDMPEDWFSLPMEPDWSNALVCTLATFRCGYFHDSFDFAQAKESAENILVHGVGLVDLYRNLLTIELVFYAALEGNIEKVKELYTKKLQSFMLLMKTSLSAQRLFYTHASLVEQDEEKAVKHLKQFEKIAATFPYEGEIESERELIDYAKGVAVTKLDTTSSKV